MTYPAEGGFDSIAAAEAGLRLLCCAAELRRLLAEDPLSVQDPQEIGRMASALEQGFNSGLVTLCIIDYDGPPARTEWLLTEHLAGRNPGVTDFGSIPTGVESPRDRPWLGEQKGWTGHDGRQGRRQQMTIAVYRAFAEPYDDPENHIFSIVASDDGAWFAVPVDTAVDNPHIIDDRVAVSLRLCYEDGGEPDNPADWASVASYNLGNNIVYVLVDSSVYDGESVSEILELETMRSERASLLRDAAEQGGNADAVTDA